MKPHIITGFLIFTGIFIASTNAQTYLGRIDSLKDGNNITCSYIGEIKNNKPHGRGMLIYTDRPNFLRHTGYFSNGLASGRGLLVFKTGGFVSATFKTGKENGKEVFLNNEGHFIERNYLNGIEEGLELQTTSKKAIGCFGKKNGMANGKMISIGSDGMTMSNIFFENGKEVGAFIEVNVEKNEKYEGYFKDGKWTNAKINFKSFIKDSSFKAYKTQEWIVMGKLDKEFNLTDTGFLMRGDKKARLFGLFKNGDLVSGAILTETERMLGSFKSGMPDGFCSILNTDNTFYQGTFREGNLTDTSATFTKNGQSYIGGIKEGRIEGKGFYSTNDNVLFIGSFKENLMDGSCIKILPSGYTTSGIWSKDSLVKITGISDPKGRIININPKTFEEGVAILTHQINNLSLFMTQETSEKVYNFHNPNQILHKVAFKSVLKLPGTEYNEVISRVESTYIPFTGNINETNEYFISTLQTRVDKETAMKTYNLWREKIKQLSIIPKKEAKPIKLVMDEEIPDKSGIAQTIFKLPKNSGFEESYTALQLFVLNDSGKDNDYSVVLLLSRSTCHFFK
jgi:hypothetical protein